MTNISSPSISTFNNKDVLGRSDGVDLALKLRKKELSPVEVTEAVIKRAEIADSKLNAIVLRTFDSALEYAKDLKITSDSPFFAGLPLFIKDNTNIKGLPSRFGTRATPSTPATFTSQIADHMFKTGFHSLGKSTMPEFGFNCSTEFDFDQPPTRNPWHTDYIAGGSSGGSAALVSSGVLPISHANDGGGSIRIPASCCGLVGLKPTRGRLPPQEKAKNMPINIVVDGVLTRSVRDTAYFYAESEKYWNASPLPKIGLVEGPNKQRLNIAVVYDSVYCKCDQETRESLDKTRRFLEGLGHKTTEIVMPIHPDFAEAFTDYWAFLAFMVDRLGNQVLFKGGFDRTKLDAFSKGLSERFRGRMLRFPYTLWKIKHLLQNPVVDMKSYDLVMSPVLGQEVPKLDYLHPKFGYETLLQRLRMIVGYTPTNNANGTPAISLPLCSSKNGLPLGIHFSAPFGLERRLLELAYELESEIPWRTL
jgi:amidase